MIKTFRGLLADGGEDKIRLSTKKGKIGYRIVKFQIFPENPGGASFEYCVKLFKITQSSVTNTVDFSDGNLLAAALYHAGSGVTDVDSGPVVIFEQETFNQDIFITAFENVGSASVNYYLELEVMSMTDNQAAVSTLRDIRLNPQVGA